MVGAPGCPEVIERAAVLTAVKDASRRFVVAPVAILDRRSARPHWALAGRDGGMVDASNKGMVRLRLKCPAHSLRRGGDGVPAPSSRVL